MATASQKSASTGKIQSGATLSGIASAAGTTVSALMKANPQITNANVIYAGQNITIPGKSTSTSSTTTKSTSTSSASPTYSQSTSQQQTMAEPPKIDNGSTLFSNYGVNVGSKANVSVKGNYVYWTNPDGSFVYEPLSSPNVKQFASQYYKPELASPNVSGGQLQPNQPIYFSKNTTYYTTNYSGFEQNPNGDWQLSNLSTSQGGTPTTNLGIGTLQNPLVANLIKTNGSPIIQQSQQTQQSQQSTSQQPTGQQTPFSGTLTEGKAYTDNQGRYYKYQNGKWQKVDQNTYNSASQKGIIAPQEGNWMEAQIGKTTPAGTYSTEFENYWKNLNPTFEKSEANKKAMWEQWNTMGPPADYKPVTNEPLPTGTGPLPMAEGEKEALIKKYVDAGYSQAQAESKVGEITSTRAPYKTGNSIIDAIVEQVTGQQLTDAGFKWNEKMQAEAKTMAEKDFGPYYTRMYETEEAQLKSGLQQYEKTYERNVEDTGLAKEKLQREYTDALQSARRTYASSGLTYSSERAGKESTLAGSLTRGLTAEETALGRSKEDIQAAEQEALAKGELRLGTSAISPLTSKYGYKSPLTTPYSGELELERRKAVAEDIQRQKTNYLQSYV